jgi:hypothetical protein
MSNFNINDISYLYEHINNQDQFSLDPESDYYDQELSELVEDIISSISITMISSGHSAEGVIDFLENASEQEILEYYLDAPSIDENFALSEDSEVELVRIDEAIGSALKLLGRAAKPALRTLKVAAKRAAGPGVRKQVSKAVSKAKDTATKAKGSIPSKERVKSAAKTALGLGAATLAGYAGGRSAGGRDSKTAPSDTKSTTTPPKPSETPSGGSGGGGSQPRSSSPRPSSEKPKASKPKKDKDIDKGPAGETPMQKWARLHPKLAAKVKPGQSGYEEISTKREKPGPNEKKDQTPTTGKPEAKVDPKEVEASIKAQQERDSKKVKKESYDAFDLVLEYLFETEQVETLTEATYVMMEMDSDAIQAIVEQKTQSVIEEIDFLIQGLIEEGYDLSDYTEEELIEAFIGEGVLDAFARTVFAIHNARKAAAAAKGVKAATKAVKATQTATKAAKPVASIPKASPGPIVKSPSGALTKPGKGGALVKSPSAAITKPGKGGGGLVAPGGSGGGKGGGLVKSSGGKMVDQSVKPVNVKDVTKGGALVAGGGSGGTGGGKGGALSAGGAGAGKGRGRKGLGLAALGLGAAGAGMLASQGRSKKETPRRQEALVGSQNAKKPLTATPGNMKTAADVNKQGGVALGKGGLGYLAKKGDKMVVKQAKAVGADDGIVGKAARALGLTKAKDKAIEAQRQATGRKNREAYLSGQGLTDKNITGYQAKGAKRKGETTGTKIKMDNN